MQSKVIAEIVQSAAKNKGVIDFTQVEKAVVRSNPPRPQDAPEHIAYIRKWGGGVDGKFVKLTNRYIHLKGYGERTISASCFGWLGKVNLPVDNPKSSMLAFIHAIVKSHACGPELKGNVCSHLSSADIQSVSGKKKEKVREAITYMKRGKDLLAEHTELSERSSIILLGDFEVRLVDFVLDKPNIDRNHTFESLINMFIKDLGSTSGVYVPPPETVPSIVNSNIVEYDNQGDVVGIQRMSLSNLGFTEGCMVYKPSKQPVVHIQQFKLIKIADDGVVTLSKMGPDGAEPDDAVKLDIPFVDFDGKWNLLKENQCIDIIKNWQAKSVNSSSDMQHLSMKGMLLSALYTLGIQHHDPHFRIHDKPIKSVFCLKDYEWQHIVIPPTTMQITVETTPKVVPYTSFVCTVGADSPYFVLSHVIQKEFVSPFWYIRKSSKRGECNLELQDHVVEMRPPKTQHVVNKDKSLFFAVPCAVNFVAVKKGDELVLFKEVKEKTEDNKDKKHTLVLDAVGQKVKKSKVT